MSDSTLKDTASEFTSPGTAVLVPRIVASPDPSVVRKQVVVRGAGLVLGRPTSTRTDNPWPIDDARLSRRHVLVGRDVTGRILVEDLQSSNGTFVNGTQIQRAILEAGDVLRLGHTLMVVESIISERDAPDLGMVGNHPKMMRLRRLITRVAPSELTALIVGDTGVGKELVARAMHAESGRPGDLVVVNCGSIPETLVESTLFGHRKGAFTGATADQKGAFHRARGGTLFLDEVGEMSLTAQPKLLRVLESGEVTPVGGTVSRDLDVRVVAATNQPMLEAVGDGRFRADLYARLAGAVIEVPTLSERRSDILDLFVEFVRSVGADRSLLVGFSERLLLYNWPRNIRELRQLAHRLAVLHPDADAWEAWMLDGHLAADESTADDDPGSPHPQAKSTPVQPMPRPSRDTLVQMLDEAGGNLSIVAERVGRSRRQIYRWMEQLEISVGTGRE